MRSHAVTIPTGPRAGALAELALHDGMASAGFRTDYQRVPKRWVTLKVTGGPLVKPERQCWSYSGGRWDAAEHNYAELRAQMDACGVVKLPTVPMPGIDVPGVAPEPSAEEIEPVRASLAPEPEQRDAFRATQPDLFGDGGR
jgi:hypothetical protein